MGTAKNGEQTGNGAQTANNQNGSSKPKTEEVDQYPEGTRLGHYVLGKFKIFFQECFF